MLRSVSDTVCYCGKNHANERLGWTVVRNQNFGEPGAIGRFPFKVYKRDCPSDERHFSADLAPFSHSNKAKAIAAGKAGHFAYRPMHHIYILCDRSHDLHVKCREALEKRYPHLTFDSDVIEGVSGVRFHTTFYDLDSPLMIELRQFCEDFVTETMDLRSFGMMAM